MADSSPNTILYQYESQQNVSQPPPAPPLPPQRPSVLQRFIAPLAFNRPGRSQVAQPTQASSASPKDTSHDRLLRRAVRRDAVHRTGIPIAAIDINQDRTHAILAGRDILKTVRVSDHAISEDYNLRNAVNTYISTQAFKPDEIHKRREYLPTKDVRWSHKHYSHVVATAAQNGRIALYDVSRSGSRVELCHLYNHNSQVNKLDFDPHLGYMLLSGSQDKFCKIWDIREPKRPQGYSQFHARAPVRDVRWSPTDAFEFALCTEEGAVQKWDIRNPNSALLGFKAHQKACYTISWHPDGKHLASGGLDKDLKIWDFKSDNRRQKPVLQLRCPAGIMNLAWRPPCWSAEFAERGTWQSTQLATSYTDGDPRTHIWDLRREYTPIRELNQFDTRPYDMLWVNKDLLWTVGGAGIFAQSDVSHAEKPEDSIPPCGITVGVNGMMYSFTEDKTVNRHASRGDPAASFLNIPQDKLSGDDGAISRSLTDDEGTDTSFAEAASRRQSKMRSTTFSRSAKTSQANTPPTQEDHPKILSLDRAVMAHKENLLHAQLALASVGIPGVSLPYNVMKEVMAGYARPTPAQEREENPDLILPTLQKAFQRNFLLTHSAGMSEAAKNWKLVESVVIPELKNWADNNRKKRWAAEVVESETHDNAARERPTHKETSPFAKLPLKDLDGKSPERTDRVKSSLFRGVVASERGSSDLASHPSSNMTTPRQQPVPTTPALKAHSTWYTMDDAIEPMQPLPPSLNNAHSAAAMESRALLNQTNDALSPPASSLGNSQFSPEKGVRGHHRQATELITSTTSGLTGTDSPKLAMKPFDDIPTATERVQTPQALSSRFQEDRRAASRDYRAQARQPFSLEAPHSSPRFVRQERHDSAESFTMFSASTESSVRARSMDRAEDAREGLPSGSIAARSQQERHGAETWAPKDNYYDSLGRSSEENDKGPRPSGSDQSDSPMLPFGLDGASESKPVPAKSESVEQRFRDVLARSPRSKDDASGHQEQSHQVTEQETDNTANTVEAKRHTTWLTKPGVQHINPLLDQQLSLDTTKLLRLSIDDPSFSLPYHVSDFRPIDITTYNPATPWALSTYPMVSKAIAVDISARGGPQPPPAHFAAQLLAHIMPFFFHPSFRRRPTLSESEDTSLHKPENLSLRLQHPAYNTRLFEGIFAQHIEQLRSYQLHVPAYNLRKLCVEEFQYPNLSGPEIRTKTEEGAPGLGLKVDTLKLKASCSTCHQPIPLNSTTCKHCKRSRAPCPICERPLSTSPDTSLKGQVPTEGGSVGSALLAYCHVCGHSAHMLCLSEFQLQNQKEYQEIAGICPVPDCGCDCGPGRTREARIADQVAARDTESAIRGQGGMVRKDSDKAGSSAAVREAGIALRGTGGSRLNGGGGFGSAGRTTAMGRSNSGSAPGSVGPASTSGGNGTSFGRRVRVVEPGE